MIEKPGSPAASQRVSSASACAISLCLLRPQVNASRGQIPGVMKVDTEIYGCRALGAPHCVPVNDNAARGCAGMPRRRSSDPTHRQPTAPHWPLT